MGSAGDWERMGREGRGGGDVVRTPRQGIRLAIGHPLAVQDGVVLCNESSRPPSMPPGCSTGRGEVLQVLVIGVDPDRSSNSFDVDSPLLKRLHHSQQLLIVDRVVELRRSELARVETYRK